MNLRDAVYCNSRGTEEDCFRKSQGTADIVDVLENKQMKSQSSRFAQVEYKL